MSTKLIPSNKILITFPFWNGDKAQSMKLARLISDLQPEHSTTADVLFVARFDAKPDAATVDYVARKFNVYTHISQRREVGWPHGCNGTFFGSMEWFYYRVADGKCPAYKAMFIAESDGCPLYADWLQHLRMEWNKVNELKPVVVAGPLIKDGNPFTQHDHINGGATFVSGDPEFLKWLVTNVSSHGINAGWDWFLSKEFEKRGWADIPSIKSYWRRPTFTEAEWLPEIKKGTVWLHGVKDDSLLEIARRKLL